MLRDHALSAALRTSAPPGLSLRPIADDDHPFLAELYASTRREELAAVPWSDEQKADFLRWQFQSQHRHYQQHYPACEFLVIEERSASGGNRIGRLYIDRWPDQIRVVDIALLPAHRGRGVGGALLQGILAEGDRAQLPVTIHVECSNPALSLYRRLGFRQVDTNGVYFLMTRTPGTVSPEADDPEARG